MAHAYKVCILNEQDARSLVYGGIAHKCSSRRHHHYGRLRVDLLVKSGELVWLGKHKRIATFASARAWVKTYSRNAYGEVAVCGMQWLRGKGGY